MPQITTVPVHRDPNLLLISSKTMNYLVTDWRTDPGFLTPCARICSYHRSQLSEIFFLKRFYQIPSPCSMPPSCLWQTILMDQRTLFPELRLHSEPSQHSVPGSTMVCSKDESTCSLWWSSDVHTDLSPPWYLALFLYQSWLHLALLSHSAWENNLRLEATFIPELVPKTQEKGVSYLTLCFASLKQLKWLAQVHTAGFMMERDQYPTS